MGGNGDASTLTTFPLSAFDPQPVKWLWPGRFPLGKVSLLQGDPSVGKSFLTLDIAARVSRGLPWPDGSGEAPQGPALLLNGEDDAADTLRPRLDNLQGDPAAVEIVAGVQPPKSEQDVPFVLDEHLTVLREHLAAAPARLVVIDPISAFLGSIDSHVNAQVRSLLAPLAGLAAAYGTAIICVSHLNKATGGKAVYRGMGSLAFVAAARAVWQLSRDPQDRLRRLLLPVKCNLAQDPTGLAFRIIDGALDWEPEAVAGDVDELLADELIRGEPRALEEAKRFLAEALDGESIRARDVYGEAADAGVARRTLERAKAALGVVVERGRGTNGRPYWTWRLPKTAKAAQYKKAGGLGDLGDLVGDTHPKTAKTAKGRVLGDVGDLGVDARLDEHDLAVMDWQRDHPEPPPAPSPAADDDAPIVPGGWTPHRWAGYLRTRAERCLDPELAAALRADADQIVLQAT